jgi:hypothetical protein
VFGWIIESIRKKERNYKLLREKDKAFEFIYIPKQPEESVFDGVGLAASF